MIDTEKIKMIREAMPSTQNTAYFNTGSVGPLSNITSRAIQQGNTQELLEGRARMSSFMAAKQNSSLLREALARLVKATPAEIALTHHTTDGMNIIAHGLPWQPGDEVITTNFEHPGGLLPLYVLRLRYGVVVKVVEFPVEPVPVVERLEAVITPRTRLIALSHITWNTGLSLPITDIVAMAHRHHIPVLIDGAQAAGVVPLDLPASGVDFYALPGQKWLCGPEGVGGLYIRREQLNQVVPTFVGFPSMDFKARHDWTGYFMPQPDARRYEVGGVYRPAIKAMVENLQWLEETVGWDWIYQRIRHLAGYACRCFEETPGITLLSSNPPQSGLVVFNLDGYDPARVMLKLAEDGIVLRYIEHPYALRISTGFFNTEQDIDRLIEALQAIQQLEPEALPVLEW